MSSGPRFAPMNLSLAVLRKNMLTVRRGPCRETLLVDESACLIFLWLFPCCRG
jgi:hypothetical protein